MIKQKTKPIIGVVPIAKVNHQKEEIYELVKEWEGYFMSRDEVECIIHKEVLFKEQEIIDIRDQLINTQNVDVVIFVVGTWIYSSMVISAVFNMQTPFILYGLSDKFANGNFGASIQIKYVLQEMNKNFLYLAGKIKDKKNFDQIIKYARASWVKSSLINKKIATIGGKCMMMYQTQVNEFDWKKVFGVDFPQYDTVQVFKEMENVEEADAIKIAEAFESKMKKVHWTAGNGEKIADDAIISQAKMYLAFKRLKQLYDIDIFANKCMPEMSAIPYGYGYAGCLATCMLNEEGIMTACEADVPAGLAMYILHLLSGGAVFFADIGRLNADDRIITFFNCGTAPISLADKEKGVEMWPISGNIADEALPEEYYIGKMKGACINFELENDRVATALRIGGNGDTLRFHIAKATTAQREVKKGEMFGQRWPGFGLKFDCDIDEFIQHTTGHHYSVVYGDYVDELKCLAEIYGIECVID